MKNKILHLLNIIIFKYIYLSALFPVVVIIIIDCLSNFKLFETFISQSSNMSSLAGISGTFIGFLLTAATIYLSLPLDSKFKMWFIKHEHHKIFVKNILFGTIFFMVPIISWICNLEILNIIGIYCFIAGCLEVIVSMYYIYHLITKQKSWIYFFIQQFNFLLKLSFYKINIFFWVTLNFNRCTSVKCFW